MFEKVSTLIDSRFNPRHIRHEIIVETNRLGIERPVDDYTLLQKMKALQRKGGGDAVATVNEHIATFAQYAFHTNPTWKEIVTARPELAETTALLERDADTPLTPEECMFVRQRLASVPVIRVPQSPEPSSPRIEPVAILDPNTKASSQEPEVPALEKIISYQNSPKKSPITVTTARTEQDTTVAHIDAPSSFPNRVAVAVMQKALEIAHGEYKKAATYFAHRGSQTRSINYGGSRSHTYMNMLKKAKTVEELIATRKEYQSRHEKPESARDEYGGLLRIAGRRLAWIPFLGAFLEKKVRADDEAMRDAKFRYPEDMPRYYARDDGSLSTSRDTDKQA